MDIAALLQRIQQKCDYAGQLEHVEILPEQEGSFSEPLQPLQEATSRLLAQRNIEQLYAHQVSALVASRLGQDLVVVTGTASGKTLAYNLPILETVFSARDARALYLFPTKALAQDQLKGLLEIVADDPSWKFAVRPGVHDGPCQRNLQQTLHKKGCGRTLSGTNRSLSL